MTPAHVVTQRTVPLSALWLEAPLWSNPRSFSGLGDDQISDLAESIRQKGISNPLIVQQILVNGEIVNLVIDGQRRAMAARSVLDADAPIPVVDIEAEACELTEEKGDELLLKALTTLEREDLSSFELLEVADRMKARGKTGEYIASALGKSPSWVSKFLKARGTAGPKLMTQWRKGAITDEQFKELAEVRDRDTQELAAKEIVRARKDGDRGEARMRSKEVKEIARKETNGHAMTNGGANGKSQLVVLDGGKINRVVAGPQLEINGTATSNGATKPAKPAVLKTPSRLVLEELVGLASKRPPVHDYVRGLMDGVRYALGFIEPNLFSKPWSQYLARIDGSRPAPRAIRAAKSKAKAGLTNKAMKSKSRSKTKAAPTVKVKRSAKAKPRKAKK